MSLASKLRAVVAANFIEIARVDTPPNQPEEKSPATVTEPVIPPVTTEPLATTVALKSAEAELDTFLKDVGASTKAVAEAPVIAEVPSPSIPEPVVPVAIVPEPVVLPPAVVSLADAISAEGDVDFARVYKQYSVPLSSFSAEQAMNMLQGLPRDVPLRTKRIMVNTTLSAIGQVVGATPRDIADDAVRKRLHLVKYLEALSDEVAETTAQFESEIESLQQEIAAKRDAVRLLNRKRTAATEVCQSRMHLFDQVINFFDYDETAINAAPEKEEASDAADQDDVPAYMNEDAVRRMLGIKDEDNGEFDPVKFAAMYGTGDEVSEPSSDNGDGAPRRASRRRNGSREVESVS